MKAKRTSKLKRAAVNGRKLVRLIAKAQLLADELGMDRDVTANLALAKMNATPLIDASGDSPNAKGQP
jgi:hypothetical protein